MFCVLSRKVATFRRLKWWLIFIYKSMNIFGNFGFKQIMSANTNECDVIDALRSTIEHWKIRPFNTILLAAGLITITLKKAKQIELLPGVVIKNLMWYVLDCIYIVAINRYNFQKSRSLYAALTKPTKETKLGSGWNRVYVDRWITTLTVEQKYASLSKR